jgi:hypothetical protein
MRKLVSFFRWEKEDRELLQSVSQKVMGTTLGVFGCFHIVATLGWRAVFSPSLYLISLGMLITGILALRLLNKYYLLAQIV